MSPVRVTLEIPGDAQMLRIFLANLQMQLANMAIKDDLTVQAEVGKTHHRYALNKRREKK